MSNHRFTTPDDIVAHLGEDYSTQFGTMAPPIYQTSLFVQNGTTPYVYSRVANPSIDLPEQKLAALEHGDGALLYTSGITAICSVLNAFLKAGDHVVAQRSVYGPGKSYLKYMEKFGVTHTLVDGRRIENFEAAITDKTRVIYLESPSTFVFEQQNLRQVADLAKAKNIITVIDNTWASPIYQNPLDFGIDVVIHSCTKYIGGHSDVIAGVAVAKGETLTTLTDDRGLFGNALPPMQGWLLSRSLRTLPIRMEHHQKSAMVVANYLENHPKVTKVFYPGLESDPQYDLFKTQLTGASGVMSFKTIGTLEKKDEMVRALRVFQYAPSWGGYDSLVNAPGIRYKFSPEDEAIFGADGLVRISVGLEDVNTLLEDLEQALSVL